MTQYTKWPWKAGVPIVGYTPIYNEGAENDAIAWVDFKNRADLVIALAAPDLLEACQWLVEEFDKTRPDFNGRELNVGNGVYNRAKAAIAKASVQS